MNRIKVLLTAAGVLTAVGSALAYSGTFDRTICYATRPAAGCNSSTSCTTISSAADVDDSGDAHCYLVVPSGTNSCLGKKCPNLGRVFLD